jgi:hypothetical protein
VQFDIFCPINVVTPTRDSRPARAVTDGDPDADPDETNHSSPSSSSTSSGSSVRSADDAEAGSDAAQRQESSSAVALVPTTRRHSELQLQQFHNQQIVYRSRSASVMGDGPLMPSLSAFSYLSTNEYFFLQYYLERLSNVLVNANSDTNPLKSLILPRIASSNLLLDAICATAAVHRSSASEKDRSEYATMATKYYVRVLSAVRDLIPRVTNSKSNSGSVSGSTSTSTSNGSRRIEFISDRESSPTNSDSSSSYSTNKNKRKINIEGDTAEMAILASIFLCKYEIIKDGIENWRLHLRGIESLCQSLDAEQTASMSNTLTYVRSLYVHDPPIFPFFPFNPTQYTHIYVCIYVVEQENDDG